MKSGDVSTIHRNGPLCGRFKRVYIFFETRKMKATEQKLWKDFICIWPSYNCLILFILKQLRSVWPVRRADLQTKWFRIIPWFNRKCSQKSRCSLNDLSGSLYVIFKPHIHSTWGLCVCRVCVTLVNAFSLTHIWPFFSITWRIESARWPRGSKEAMIAVLNMSHYIQRSVMFHTCIGLMAETFLPCRGDSFSNIPISHHAEWRRASLPNGTDIKMGKNSSRWSHK